MTYPEVSRSWRNGCYPSCITEQGLCLARQKQNIQYLMEIEWPNTQQKNFTVVYPVD